ncbi:MAG: hypothetical protein WEF28_01020, partial [Acidimicrobiia bacterium]
VGVRPTRATTDRRSASMSAYMVSVGHIDVLISAGLRRGMSPLRWYDVPIEVAVANNDPVHSIAWHNEHSQELTVETADQVGAILLNENRESVNWRYDEEELEPIYQFRQTDTYPIPELLSAISGYEYQACEHLGWHLSQAKQFCDALRQRLCAEIRAEEGWSIDEARYLPGISMMDMIRRQK